MRKNYFLPGNLSILFPSPQRISNFKEIHTDIYIYKINRVKNGKEKMIVTPGRKGVDKYRQLYSNPSLAKHLLNKAAIYSIQNETKIQSFKQNPPILSKTHMQIQSLRRLLTAKFSQPQIMYDNINPLWLGSCLDHSGESYRVVDRELAPLSTPTLLERDEGENSKVFASAVSSWKIISPIFTAIEEQTG